MKLKVTYHIITCILLFTGMFVNAQQLRVCSNCKIKTIQEAVKVASKHDSIYLGKGVYNEHDIFINKPLTIIGNKEAIINGNKKGYILKIASDSVAINGITLENVGKSYTKDFAAIYISKSKYFKIENVRLKTVFFGILIEKSHHGLIKNNHISSEAKDEAGSGNGIHLWHSSNVLIEENKVHNLRDGIYFEFVTHSKVLNNSSFKNLRYGLHFMFSNNDEYHHNTFENNGSGVAVMFSKFITMTNNTFLKNWGTASYGLLLKEIYDAEINNNTFQENTTAINIEGSTRINYSKNTFTSNGWALKIAGACYANKFYRNNFLNNSFDLSYNSKLNDNSFNNNYWSSYTGYDLDKNGIGDVPYRPVKLFSYVVNKTPEAIVLLRSLFVDIINFSEKISPAFTPDNLVDKEPSMNKIE
ncbi:nitrous oxide reductase family maturation protein NosD [uncultured Tenacibaculum sp.]|uniref:nitrous oxide reductase family maturation protein NosD n=1 Tax=uncultured Tenacibaculum sp. TaxID=174713 RepID=UPI0026253CC7|nr:nitrous oxide reductase family maturation protein NosD [uncultured Tenacibaculum sp.]